MNAAITRRIVDQRRLGPEVAARQPARPLFARRGRRPGAGAASDRYRGLHLGNELQWSYDESIESTIFRALSGPEPSVAEASLLRAIFISCVDHTPATPSSLAAITSYSGGNSLKTALAAGITAMGDSHAGAGEGTARILTEYVAKMRAAVAAAGVFEADGVRITDVMDLAGYIINKVTGAYGGEKGRIPGYGHRHYGIYGRDPRAVALLSIAESLGLAGEYCHLAREIESILKKEEGPGPVLQRRRRDRGYCAT